MKSKTTQKTNNTYGWQTPPKTEAQTRFDNQIGHAFDGNDPNIAYGFNQARENFKNNIINDPWGPEVSSEVQKAQMTSGLGQLDMQQGLALRTDTMNRNLAKVGAYGQSAAMQAPQLVQTGGTMTGTQTTPLGPALIGLAGNLGSSAIMA